MSLEPHCQSICFLPFTVLLIYKKKNLNGEEVIIGKTWRYSQEAPKIKQLHDLDFKTPKDTNDVFSLDSLLGLTDPKKACDVF